MQKATFFNILNKNLHDIKHLPYQVVYIATETLLTFLSFKDPRNEFYSMGSISQDGHRVCYHVGKYQLLKYCKKLE